MPCQCTLQPLRPGHRRSARVKFDLLHTNSCVRGCHPRPVTLMENSESTRPHRGVPLPMGSPALWLVTSPAPDKPSHAPLLGGLMPACRCRAKLCARMGACLSWSMPIKNCSSRVHMRLRLQSSGLLSGVCAMAISRRSIHVCASAVQNAWLLGLQADVALPDSLCAVTIDNKVCT